LQRIRFTCKAKPLICAYPHVLSAKWPVQQQPVVVAVLAVILVPTLSTWIAALYALGAADPLDRPTDFEHKRLSGRFFVAVGLENGGPSWIRTSDPSLRRRVLYPAELWDHSLAV
jgi:hypothetical protein